MTTEARRASKKRATVQIMLLVYWYITQMVPHEAHVIHARG